MDRRGFLKLASVAPVAAAIPLALPARPESGTAIRRSLEVTLTPYETTLRMSDLREVAQYCINNDQFILRHDIRFTVNGRGKWRQYHVDSELGLGDTFETLRYKREFALRLLQDRFNASKRIRANLLPLKVPRGLPTAEEFIRGMR